MSSSSTKLITQTVRTWRGWGSMMDKVNILYAGEGKCSASMKIEKEHTDVYGKLHSGVTASLIDIITGVALMSSNNKSRNVSVNIQISFLQPASLGDEIIFDANTVNIEKNTADVTIEICDKTTNNLLVKGIQTLFMMQKK